MATAGIDLDGGKEFDDLVKEIVRCFEDCHIILETRKNLLLEKVRQMKELYQKHRDIVKVMEQMEIVRKATNDALTENSIADDKNQVVSFLDDKIRNLKDEKLKLDEFSELKFVPNIAEFEQCVNKFHLSECGVMEFCKRREPCFMKRFGNDNLGQNLIGYGLALDTDTDLLYVTDICRTSVCIFSKDGELMKIFGEEYLSHPFDLCLTKEYVFVSDIDSVVKFSKSGEYINSSDNGHEVTGICTSLQSVYVCNHTEGRIEVFDLDLVYIESFRQEILKHPRTIQAYESKIFVLTVEDISIHVFDSSHNYLHNIALPGVEFDVLLYYFTIDLSGNFILSDRGAHCIKVYNAKGELIETLGNGYLTSPYGIATDRNNRIIVVSESYNSLQLY